MRTSYLTVAGGELENQPIVKEGTKILHKHKNGWWEESTIEYGKIVNKDGTEETSNMLGYYKLKNGVCYLASINDRLLNRPNLKLKGRSKNGRNTNHQKSG